MEKHIVSQLKDEQKLRRKLKELFPNDFELNSRTSVLEPGAVPSTSDNQKRNNVKTKIKATNKKPILKETKKLMAANSSAKMNKVKDFSKTVENLKKNKNKPNVPLQKKIFKYKYGPIATGYIPIGSNNFDRKRSTKEIESTSSKKQKICQSKLSKISNEKLFQKIEVSKPGNVLETKFCNSSNKIFVEENKKCKNIENSKDRLDETSKKRQDKSSHNDKNLGNKNQAKFQSENKLKTNQKKIKKNHKNKRNEDVDEGSKNCLNNTSRNKIENINHNKEVERSIVKVEPENYFQLVVNSSLNKKEDNSYDFEYDDDFFPEEESSYNNELSEYEDESSLSDDFSEYEDEFEEYDFESSSNDEDYKPPKDMEDLYVPKGIAVKYDINETMNIKFNSDSNEAQIIELTTEPIQSKNIKNYFPNEEYLNLCNARSGTNIESDSNSSCPQLVPIYDDFHTINFNQNETLEETSSEITYEQSSDCCSEYSEATEGSLCFVDQEDKKEEASKMMPKIFKIDKGINAEYSFGNQSFLENNNICSAGPNIMDDILENSAINDSSEFRSNILTTLKEKDLYSDVKHKSRIIEEIQEELNSKFYNGMDSRHVLVLLKKRIHIYGALKVQLIAGSIDIFGYVPNINETVELYSPRGYSFLNISPCKNITSIDLSENLMKCEKLFLTTELNDIKNNFDPKNDAVLLLQRNCLTKTIGLLGKYMKENIFPNMSPVQIDRPYYASEFVLRSVIYEKTDNEVIVDPKWKKVDINSTTRLMIIGGKSVGKSTCLRYIVNKEIKRHEKILLIDLDIGQSEIFLPQTISATVLKRPLLGPGYFLNLDPDKAIVYGDINVVLDPERYLQIIKELSKYCHKNEDFKNIPWCINTMGYNKGFGNELIAVLCHYFRPTEILQLQSSNSANNFDYLMEKEVLQIIPLNVFKKDNLLLETSTELLEYLENLDFNIRIMPSMLTEQLKKRKRKAKEWTMYSKDARYAMIIIKLGSILGNKYNWLTDVKPMCCSLENIRFKLYSNDNLTHEELLDIINANLVYLCRYENDVSPLECYGIGIVRGVDKIYKKIYLISSVAYGTMKHVNCLSICNVPLPSSVILNQGPKIKGDVPYTYNTNEFVASRAIKHFNRIKVGYTNQS